MMHAPYVTVGVPIYHGGAVIEESLRSIQQQSHRDLQVILSLDGPQPDSEELCRPFLKDARFELVVQPERLGWVGNTNYLIGRVETPYWLWHPQDDILDERCIEVLLEHAQRNAAAAVVYSDIASFGLRNETLIQPSVTGDPVARQLTLIREHVAAIAFRGLTRAEALRFCGRVPSDTSESYALDTVWMAALARWGELQRVPQTLYRKRYHPGNEHSRWFGWPAEARRRAWISHCADMLAQAMLVPATADERHALWLAILERLTRPQWTAYFHESAEWTAADAAALLQDFMEHIRGRGATDVPSWLDDRWAETENAARDHLLARKSLLGREAELAARGRELAARDRQLAARDRQLVARDSELAAWKREVSARDRELAQITSSRAWGLALAMRRLRLMLAPIDSLRARTLRAASRILARLVG
jgi:GT2 family glycosyltransferase